MRLFIAVNFDENMTDALIEMQDDLSENRDYLKDWAAEICKKITYTYFFFML